MIPDPPSPADCERCGTELVSRLFCFQCRMLQHFPAKLDHFQVLGLPRQFIQDAKVLEERFQQLVTETHPDFYMNEPAELQRLSERASMLLNTAYGVLISPFSRAEYLLKLLTEPGSFNERILPAGFLEEVFELQERLDELQVCGAEEELSRMKESLKNRCTEMETRLPRMFALLNNHKRMEKTLEQVRMTLNAGRYLQRLLERFETETVYE